MRQAIALNKELKHMTWLQMNYFNLGELFFINGQLDSAMIYNQYAYDIADELGDLKSMSGIKVAMSRQNLKRTGDLNSCIVLAHEAYGLAASTDSKKEIYEAATLLKELYEQENNLDSAYKYAIIMFRMKDSLDIDKTNANIAKLEMLHELDKEMMELEKAKDDTILRIILVAGTLFFVLVLVVAFNYRSTVKSKLALLEKQKEADDQLRQSEAKFRGVFNSMVDVFTRSTMDGKCVIVSPSIHKLFGYHPEEVIGRNLADFYANPGERNEIIQRLNDSNEVEHFEFEAVKKNGDIITVSANAKIYHDEDGNPLGVEGVIRDVTEKNRAEKALQESEALFRGVFNNMIDVFTRADIKGNCLLISPSVYDILGYIPEEIIGKNYEEFFARPEDWKNLNQKLIDAGAMRDVQSELVRKDGSRAIISSNAKIFYDEEGNPAGMESVFRDITDQKRAESEHDKLFNVSFDLLCIAGFDGYFKELNPAWEKATGYTANELKSKPFLEFIHPDDRENTLEEFQLLLNGEMTYSFENRYIRKNGETMYLSWTATPVRDEELLYSIARDITERKKIEHQLANYQKRLKDLTTEIILAEERVRKQIAADLHDHVGQLLTSIRMQLVSLNKMVDNAEASTRINGISQAALTAVQATREAIFNLSLPQLNELGLVAATHDWMKEQIQEKHFIKTSLEGEDLVLNIDENTRVLLFRSLRELMMNVVKHAQAKNLKINFQTKDDDLVITVEDDGVGFHYNAQMVRLQGKGFGLFSIQERLSDLGGTMKVTSAPGQGTTIELKTPLNKVLA
jgi:PAS domain S-box-containing protein